jgi:hypothetical protein
MTLEAAHPKSIDAKAISLFSVVTFGLGLAMALPLWLSGLGLRTPTARILLTLMMFAPAVGVLVVPGRGFSDTGSSPGSALRSSDSRHPLLEVF